MPYFKWFNNYFTGRDTRLGGPKGGLGGRGQAQKKCSPYFGATFRLLFHYLGELPEKEQIIAGITSTGQILAQIVACFSTTRCLPTCSKAIDEVAWEIRSAMSAMKTYCNLAYSALASFRMGMSGSASFQRVRKS